MLIYLKFARILWRIFGENLDISFYERWKGTLSLEQYQTLYLTFAVHFQFNSVDKLGAISWVFRFKNCAAILLNICEKTLKYGFERFFLGLKSELLMKTSLSQGDVFGGLNILVENDVKRCPHEIVQKRGLSTMREGRCSTITSKYLSWFSHLPKSYSRELQKE